MAVVPCTVVDRPQTTERGVDESQAGEVGGSSGYKGSV